MVRPAPQLLVLALCALCATACGPAEQPAPPSPAGASAVDWPPGTVLAVEGSPITLEEIDEASVWVERVSPSSTPDHLRRLALTNVVLPRHLARLLAGTAREQALEQARAELARLRAGTWEGTRDADGNHGQGLSGGYLQLGLELWGRGSDLPPGEWSEPFESEGRFVLLRRTALRPAPVPIAIEIDADVLVFPFLDRATYPREIESAYDRFHLTVVDPSWRALVPESLQYRMGASPP